MEIVGDGNIDGGRKKKHGEQLSPKAMITPVVQSCHPYSHDKQLAASDQSRLRHWCIGALVCTPQYSHAVFGTTVSTGSRLTLNSAS